MSADDASLPSNPNMAVAQLRFEYSLNKADATKDALLAAIKADGIVRAESGLLSHCNLRIVCTEMTPVYESVCAEFGFMVNDVELAAMKEANKTKLEALEAAITGQSC